MARDREKQKEAQRRWYQNNKERQARRQREKRIKRREWFEETFMKGRRCEHCAENDPIVMEFHHTDPTEKEDTISKMLHKLRTKEQIAVEVEKCIMLCANCHRKEHHRLKLKLEKEIVG